MTQEEKQKKLEHLASQVPKSEDMDACPKCCDGKHMECAGPRCLCEWCS